MEKPHGVSGWQPRGSTSQGPAIIDRYTGEGTHTKLRLDMFLTEVPDIWNLDEPFVLPYLNSWPMSKNTAIIDLCKLQSVGDGL